AVIFIIDEFEELVSNSFLPALAMARAKGLGVVMCHQGLSQLNLGDHDLTDTILSTTVLKLILNAQDLRTRELIIKTSGEVEEPSISCTQEFSKYLKEFPPGFFHPSRAWGHNKLFLDPTAKVGMTKRPRVNMNDVNEVNADSCLSFANFVTDRGPM